MRTLAKRALFAFLLMLVAASAPVGFGTASVSAYDPLGGWPNPLLSGHDHDLDPHLPSTPTLEHLSRVTPGDVLADDFAHLYGEIARLGPDHIAVAGYPAMFSIWDIRDRATPRWLTTVPFGALLVDLKGTEDGELLLVGTQTLFSQTEGSNEGIYLFSTLVKEAPVLLGYYPLVGGCHMLAVHGDLVACAPFGKGVHLFRLVRAPTVAATLVPLGTYAPFGVWPVPIVADKCQLQLDLFCPTNAHDMTIQRDPLTGTLVMSVSFWSEGIHVVDLTDPTNPQKLAIWDGEGAGSRYAGTIHTAMLTRVGDRRILLGIAEDALEPALYVVDATDLSGPVLLDAWVPQPRSAYRNDMFTLGTHNFQVANGRVYLASYHAPVWVIDISRVHEGVRPYALGYATLAGEDREPETTWDVLLIDGYLYASDSFELHTFRYVGDTLGDASATGFA